MTCSCREETYALDYHETFISWNIFQDCGKIVSNGCLIEHFMIGHVYDTQVCWWSWIPSLTFWINPDPWGATAPGSRYCCWGIWYCRGCSRCIWPAQRFCDSILWGNIEYLFLEWIFKYSFWLDLWKSTKICNWLDFMIGILNYHNKCELISNDTY